jgi:tetratricopeptide (TPR) repeat protein
VRNRYADGLIVAICQILGVASVGVAESGMKLRNYFLCGTLVIGGSLAEPATDLVFAQDPQPQEQPAPEKPADEPPPAKKTPPKKNADNATQSAPEQPTWDPLRAEKDLEVGQYYMRKGDLDAAIDRFQDATTAKPGFAIPFRFLGEAQEKKGLKKQAIKSYQRYLDMVPRADDADKVKKKIEKLYKEVEKDKK